MGRKRKQRRQPHGSAWHWKQTDCWYYTRPGTKKRVPLFPDLMGPPPKSDGRKASERHDERDVPSHPSVAPGSAADEAYLAGATQPRRLLNKVLNVSLWRLGRQNQPSDEIVGKVDR